MGHMHHMSSFALCSCMTHDLFLSSIHLYKSNQKHNKSTLSFRYITVSHSIKCMTNMTHEPFLQGTQFHIFIHVGLTFQLDKAKRLWTVFPGFLGDSVLTFYSQFLPLCPVSVSFPFHLLPSNPPPHSIPFLVSFSLLVYIYMTRFV